jgi:5-methylcytosine-specific restriction endonuclease McrA
MQTLGLPSSARDPSARLRQDRLTAARLKGCHSKDEWLVLHDLFGACVACGIQYSDLIGGRATKDHIHPLYAGGCDCIANLQPLCRECNASGVSGDLRNRALPGWQTLFLHKMGAFF